MKFSYHIFCITLLWACLGVVLSSCSNGGAGSESNASQSVLTLGGSQMCRVQPDKTIKCVGDNRHGQLGDGTTTTSATPVTVKGITDAVGVAAGGGHTCALRASGEVMCWGINSSGELGDGTTTNSLSPVTVQGIGNATGLTASFFHTCALLTDHTIKCWGDNFSGQLGNGTTSTSATSTPVLVAGINNATAIAADTFHTCALLTDHTVKCWGSNANGQLGNGTTVDSATPVAVNNIDTAIAISASDSQSCALLAEHSVRCWGSGRMGSLGNGSTTDSSVPVPVSGINTAVALENQCVLLMDRGVKCWGVNSVGELGAGNSYSESFTTTPVTVSDINSAIAIAGNGGTNCAILADNSVWCWGGTLWKPTAPYSSVPVTVKGLNSVTALATGHSHNCALLSDQTAKCWGSNSFGQLGNGTVLPIAFEPIAVTGLSAITSLSAGVQESCAIITDGRLYCWGLSLTGTVFPTAPSTLSGFDITTAVTATGAGICALSINHTIECLPYGATAPTPVQGITTALAFSSAEYNEFDGCAVLADQTVSCWGGAYDDNGNPPFTSVAITGIANATTVSAGINQSCAVLIDGTVSCWINSRGTPPMVTRTPAVINGVSNAISIAVGGDHACAVLADGGIKCWGLVYPLSNRRGQLGDGTTNDSSTPVTVSGINSAIAVSANWDKTCALLSDKTVKCWGDNTGNQLGDFPTASAIPIQVQGL